MNVFRYPGKSLIGDYIRSGVGLAVGLSVLASASSSITVVIIFGGITGIFLVFGFRTVKAPKMMTIVIDDDALARTLSATARPTDERI